MTSNFFFLHEINQILVLTIVHKIIDILSVSDEILGKITIMITTNGVTFGIDEVRKKTQAVASFFFTKITSARFFDNFRCSDLDGSFTLTGTPEALVRFHIKTNDGSKIGFHRLVFFQR